MDVIKTLNKQFKKYLKGFTEDEIERIELHYSFQRKTFQIGIKSTAQAMGVNTYDYLEEGPDPFAALNLIRFRNGLNVIKNK